ncbi:MAG TPA: SWIM zinc finger family protein [Nitrososphaeraceae archaeon]|nr:SWIM zinc finger family protein [Nitrososphaeraceae archaeon]
MSLDKTERIALVETRRIHKFRGQDMWLVESDKIDKKFYHTNMRTCECPYFKYRGGPCKHQGYVMEKEAKKCI